MVKLILQIWLTSQNKTRREAGSLPLIDTIKMMLMAPVHFLLLIWRESMVEEGLTGKVKLDKWLQKANKELPATSQVS